MTSVLHFLNFVATEYKKIILNYIVMTNAYLYLLHPQQKTPSFDGVSSLEGVQLNNLGAQLKVSNFHILFRAFIIFYGILFRRFYQNAKEALKHPRQRVRHGCMVSVIHSLRGFIRM